MFGDLRKSIKEAVYITSDNVTGRAKYEMSFPSPNAIVLLAEEIGEEGIASYEWED